MRIVVAVDGSAVSTRVAGHVARLFKQLAKKPEVILVHADAPLVGGPVIHLSSRGVDRCHAENAKHAMAPAQKVLDRAGVEYSEVVLIDEPAKAILKFLQSSRCDHLVMGSHGRGAFKNLVLGSVATKVVSASTVPVTIIR